MKKKYYLHSKARKEGFRLVTKERTFYVKPDTELTKTVKRLLKEFHYQIQYTL